MKKILFVSTNDHVDWGGSEVLWSRTAKILAEGGYRVMASVWDWEPEPAGINALRSSGVLLHKRSLHPLGMGRLGRAWTMLRQGYVKAQVSNELEALALFSPDLVVFSIGDHLCGKFLRYAERVQQKGIPYVVIVQLVNEYRYVIDGEADRFIAAYQGGVRVYFVSDQNRSILERQLAIDLQNARVMNNPVEFSDATDVAYPDSTEGFRFAMVANLLPLHKGQDLVFEVLAQRKWKDRALRLNLYGTGAAAGTLERLRSLRSLDNVTFNGHLSDKGSIWRENHAALFASRMEGQSLALLEAMAHKRMVITTDVGGARELITDGSEGFIVPFPQVEALDRAMERAWDTRMTWEAMGRRAQTSVRSFVKADPVMELARSLERMIH